MPKKNHISWWFRHQLSQLAANGTSISRVLLSDAIAPFKFWHFAFWSHWRIRTLTPFIYPLQDFYDNAMYQGGIGRVCLWRGWGGAAQLRGCRRLLFDNNSKKCVCIVVEKKVAARSFCRNSTMIFENNSVACFCNCKTNTTKKASIDNLTFSSTTKLHWMHY